MIRYTLAVLALALVCGCSKQLVTAPKAHDTPSTLATRIVEPEHECVGQAWVVPIASPFSSVETRDRYQLAASIAARPNSFGGTGPIEAFFSPFVSSSSASWSVSVEFRDEHENSIGHVESNNNSYQQIGYAGQKTFAIIMDAVNGHLLIDVPKQFFGGSKTVTYDARYTGRAGGGDRFCYPDFAVVSGTVQLNGQGTPVQLPSPPFGAPELSDLKIKAEGNNLVFDAKLALDGFSVNQFAPGDPSVPLYDGEARWVLGIEVVPPDGPLYRVAQFTSTDGIVTLVPYAGGGSPEVGRAGLNLSTNHLRVTVPMEILRNRSAPGWGYAIYLMAKSDGITEPFHYTRNIYDGIVPGDAIGDQHHGHGIQVAAE